MPPEDRLTDDEARELLQFDPFENPPEPEPAPEPDPALEAAPADQAPTAAAATAGDAQPAATVPPTSIPQQEAGAAPASGGTVEVGILQRLVESQARQIEALTRQMADRPPVDGRQAAGQSPSSSSPQGVGAASDLPSYDFEIPDDLVDALASDDARVRKAGIRALVKGTALSVHQKMMEAIEPRFKQLPTEMETRFENRRKEAEAVAEMRKDFFGSFPELNRPELAQFVGQVQATVIAETGLKAWSPTLRDAIGNRARQILGLAVRTPAQPAPMASPVIRPAVPAPPPAMQGSNTRPPAAAERSVDEVWELVMTR